MSEPSGPGQTPGGMSPSQGQVNLIKSNGAKVDIYDKSVLRTAICQCKDAPGKDVDGRSLKQGCVSGALKAVDKAMDHKSPYKPEINYDMTQQPPAPIMDRNTATKGHDWLPGWIRKWWAEGAERPPFVAGEGMVRRPDVVIVKDASKPPTQGNIKQVVEMKFPPDVLSPEHKDDYETIAGSSDKFAVLGPENCSCGSRPDPSKVPAPNSQSLAAGTLILIFLGLVLAP